jgi:hypothetical protein
MRSLSGVLSTVIAGVACTTGSQTTRSPGDAQVRTAIQQVASATVADAEQQAAQTYRLSAWSQSVFQQILDDPTVFSASAKAGVLALEPFAGLHRPTQPPQAPERTVTLTPADWATWDALYATMSAVQRNAFVQARGDLVGSVQGTTQHDERFWNRLIGL